jgi:uncharacterized membrane protein YeaQ/YmgE (transglycosylase-associated protein family)
VSLPTWIIVGVVAGFVINKIINRSGEYLAWDMGLGIVGALIGGLLFSSFGPPGMGEPSVYTFAIPVAGAVGCLVTYHVLLRRSR